MSPRLYLVRHAQGEHNATRNYTIHDPLLTEKGKAQCKALRDTFEYHNTINVVLASPLRRTIQTAALSFGPMLARDVPFIAVPEAQEVGDMKSDTGLPVQELERCLPELFKGDDLEFDIKRLDLSAVKEGWDSKGSTDESLRTGYYAYTREAISKRASDLRNWLFQRPESHILLVTHGAFLHFLTEDWDVEDPMTTTAYHNCELRIFDFTSKSTETDAHVSETAHSRISRGKDEPEQDPHVLEELEKVSSKDQ